MEHTPEKTIFETDEYYTKECNCWKLMTGLETRRLMNTKHHESCAKFDKDRELCWLDHIVQKVKPNVSLSRIMEYPNGMAMPGFLKIEPKEIPLAPGVVEVYCNDKIPEGKVDFKNDKGEVVGTIENLEFKCDGVVPEFPSDFLNADTLKPVLPIDHVDVGVFCDPPAGSHEQGEKIT